MKASFAVLATLSLALLAGCTDDRRTPPTGLSASQAVSPVCELLEPQDVTRAADGKLLALHARGVGTTCAYTGPNRVTILVLQLVDAGTPEKARDLLRSPATRGGRPRDVGDEARLIEPDGRRGPALYFVKGSKHVSLIGYDPELSADTVRRLAEQVAAKV